MKIRYIDRLLCKPLPKKFPAGAATDTITCLHAFDQLELMVATEVNNLRKLVEDAGVSGNANLKDFNMASHKITRLLKNYRVGKYDKELMQGTDVLPQTAKTMMSKLRASEEPRQDRQFKWTRGEDS